MKVGDRVKLVKWFVSTAGGWDDSVMVPPGTSGTVTEIPKSNPLGQKAWVKFDNGPELCVLEDDQVYVVDTVDRVDDNLVDVSS